MALRGEGFFSKGIQEIWNRRGCVAMQIVTSSQASKLSRSHQPTNQTDRLVEFSDPCLDFIAGVSEVVVEQGEGSRGKGADDQVLL